MKPDDMARKIRAACLETAREAYEDAGVRGLCAEGRWEAAMSALEMIDIQAILREIEHPAGDERTGATCANAVKATTK